MDTTTTGARSAHQSPAPSAQDERNIRQLAQDIQAEVHRLKSLAAAIDDAIDYASGAPAAEVGPLLGRTFDYLHLHQQIVPKVLAMAEQIEVEG